MKIHHPLVPPGGGLPRTVDAAIRDAQSRTRKLFILQGWGIPRHQLAAVRLCIQITSQFPLHGGGDGNRAEVTQHS